MNTHGGQKEAQDSMELLLHMFLLTYVNMELAYAYLLNRQIYGKVTVKILSWHIFTLGIYF